ncbi:hypothetical protein IG631_22412 [Alternaria alternata]|nr:hypothetical protein IG631_22412 [Alternaria alternata]
MALCDNVHSSWSTRGSLMAHSWNNLLTARIAVEMPIFRHGACACMIETIEGLMSGVSQDEGPRRPRCTQLDTSAMQGDDIVGTDPAQQWRVKRQ